MDDRKILDYYARRYRTKLDKTKSSEKIVKQMYLTFNHIS